HTDRQTAELSTRSLHDALPIFVRHVQEARKKKGLEITDRIRLQVDAVPELRAAIDGLRDYIAEETLAVGIDLSSDLVREDAAITDRKSTRLNSSHVSISYAVFC